MTHVALHPTYVSLFSGVGMRKRRDLTERVICACGCGESRLKWGADGRPRQFVFGHHARIMTEARQRRRDAMIGQPAWNSGKTYVMAKKESYANRGAWRQALVRLFGDGCMRCGWAEAPSDTHHITPRRRGGQFSVENGILLCPNCHRLVEVGKIATADLVAIRRGAQEKCFRAG